MSKHMGSLLVAIAPLAVTVVATLWSPSLKHAGAAAAALVDSVVASSMVVVADQLAMSGHGRGD